MTGEQLLALRKSKRLNQTQFWGNIGLTQSAGSRYESGRGIPKPVEILVQLIYADTQNKAFDRMKELRKCGE